MLNRQTGTLWSVEHGAAGGDEINTPAPGKITVGQLSSYGTHYSGTKIGVGTHYPEHGAAQMVLGIHPSRRLGLAYYDGDQPPKWRGNLFVGALRGAMLVRLKLDGTKIVSEERL